MDSKVSNIYVIRRKLNAHVIPRMGSLAHSGLLLETNNKNYYILEYGTTHRDNDVLLRKVEFSKYSSDKFTELSEDKYTWQKQVYGTELTKDLSLMNIKNIMDVYGNQRDYSLLHHNCHMAQEFTRHNLGLDVEHPFNTENISGGVITDNIPDNSLNYEVNWDNHNSLDYGSNNHNSLDYGSNNHNSLDYGLNNHNSLDYGSNNHNSLDYGLNNHNSLDYGSIITIHMILEGYLIHRI